MDNPKEEKKYRRPRTSSKGSTCRDFPHSLPFFGDLVVLHTSKSLLIINSPKGVCNPIGRIISMLSGDRRDIDGGYDFAGGKGLILR